MKRTFRHIITASALILSALTVSAAPQTLKIRAQADSTMLTMGDCVDITVEVFTPSAQGNLVDLPKPEEDYHGLELAAIKADTVTTGSGDLHITYRLTMQGFTPMPVVLPGFRYALGTDTIASDPLVLKVMPIELSPELGNIEDVENLTIHPEESVVKIPSKWYDYVPDWTIWVILGLAVAALGVVLFLLYKKNGPRLFVAKKPTPPYEIAMQRLLALKNSRLMETGSPKAYFTELTDILRQYLEGRFGIYAMEMTSTDIVRSLRDNKETRLTADQIQTVLSLADFVKFAAVRPPQDDYTKMYNTVLSFVESTKPAEPTEEEQKKKN